MRIILLSASFFVLFFSATGFAKEKTAKDISAVIERPNSCKLMGDNLYNCTPFECDTHLPDSPDAKVHNKISGMDKDGNCVSEQSNAGGEKVICKYSDESRKFLALRMKKAQTDLANMPESTEFEENILADIFHNECEVVSDSADDKPVVNEDDESALEDEQDESAEFREQSGLHRVNSDAGEDADPEKVPDNGDLLDSKD